MQSSPDSKFKGNLLVVDDLVQNLQLLTELLHEQGYEVRSVTNGKMALRTAKAKPPDVILLDIKMPEMDGYQVCKALKEDEDTREIPVIFLSALDEVFDKVNAFQVGGIDYITKPFQVEEVIARIDSQLTIQQQKRLLQKEIQQRKQAEEILYQSRALLASVLNSSLDGIAALQAIRDSTGEILDFRCLVVNPAIAKAMGITRDDLIGKLVLKKFLKKFNFGLFDAFVRVVDTGEALEQELCYKNASNRAWYHLIAVKLGDGFSVTIRDITERKNLELELDRQAKRDGLTQVANRRCFNEILTKEWRRCTRERQPLSLILCDVDRFKSFNDRFGHQVGDTCLIQVAEAIARVARRPGDLVARYGGEEFAVILPNTNVEGAVQVVQSIQKEMRHLELPDITRSNREAVTLSLGIASFIPTQTLVPEALIAEADRALYTAKESGRDRYCIHPNSQTPLT